MQLNTPIGPVFTKQQTIQPFTEQLRLFNLKEANSTGNCIGCNKGDAYIKDSEKALKKFLQEFERSKVSQDELHGSFTVENFANEEFERDSIGSLLNNGSSPFIAADDSYIDPTNADVVHNELPKDFTYNSYSDDLAPTFNMWTRIYDDNCNEENRLRIASKPMKYYVNQYNSPQVDPFIQYSIIGNQKQYDVRNEYERPVPTRLNPIYPTQVEPYPTSPFLGSNNPDRTYVDTSDALRWSREMGIKSLKSETALSEKNYNRWDFVDTETVQNAGQFNLGSKLQTAGSVGKDGYYRYDTPNHVIMGNGAAPYFGLSSRNLLHNISDLTNCG